MIYAGEYGLEWVYRLYKEPRRHFPCKIQVLYFLILVLSRAFVRWSALNSSWNRKSWLESWKTPRAIVEKGYCS